MYIKKRYPVYVLKNCADIAYTATTICDNFGDLLQVPRSSVVKIYVVSLTFLGYHAMSNEADITTLLRSKLGDDPERSCGLIITPNTGLLSRHIMKPRRRSCGEDSWTTCGMTSTTCS